MSTHDPSHHSRARRTKDPLDAKTRRLLDRLLTVRSPVPDPVPDPSAIVYRSWTIERSPDELHRMVCERLRARWLWVRDAFVFWDVLRLDEMRAATTREQHRILAALRFPSLVSFLQCLTIDDPAVERDGRSFPMMSTSGPREIGGPMREPDLAYVEHHPNSIANLRARFYDVFLREWLFHPSSDKPRDEPLLAEYQSLYQELRQRQKQVAASGLGRAKSRPALVRRGIWAETIERLLSAPTVTVGNKAFAVPRDWTDYVSASCPPSEVARVLLAHAWKHDFQDVKERLARLRRERPILRAWATYEAWFLAQSERLKELEVLIRGWPGILAPSKLRVTQRRRRRTTSSSAPRYPSPPFPGGAVEATRPLLSWPPHWPTVLEPAPSTNPPATTFLQ